MLKIIIDEESRTADDLADLLEQLAEQIRDGNIRGFYPHWHLEGDEEEQIDDGPGEPASDSTDVPAGG
jgi:hypothetical protein